MVLSLDVGEPLKEIIKEIHRTPATEAHFGTHECQKENESMAERFPACRMNSIKSTEFVGGNLCQKEALWH